MLQVVVKTGLTAFALYGKNTYTNLQCLNI